MVGNFLLCIISNASRLTDVLLVIPLQDSAITYCYSL